MEQKIKEITDAMEEQKMLMIEMAKLDLQDTEIKLKKQKIQKKLALAKERVRSITYS